MFNETQFAFFNNQSDAQYDNYDGILPDPQLQQGQVSGYQKQNYTFFEDQPFQDCQQGSNPNPPTNFPQAFKESCSQCQEEHWQYMKQVSMDFDGTNSNYIQTPISSSSSPLWNSVSKDTLYQCPGSPSTASQSQYFPEKEDYGNNSELSGCNYSTPSPSHHSLKELDLQQSSQVLQPESLINDCCDIEINIRAQDCNYSDSEEYPSQELNEKSKKIRKMTTENKQDKRRESEKGKNLMGQARDTSFKLLRKFLKMVQNYSKIKNYEQFLEYLKEQGYHDIKSIKSIEDFNQLLIILASHDNYVKNKDDKNHDQTQKSICNLKPISERGFIILMNFLREIVQSHSFLKTKKALQKLENIVLTFNNMAKKIEVETKKISKEQIPGVKQMLEEAESNKQDKVKLNKQNPALYYLTSNYDNKKIIQLAKIKPKKGETYL